MTSRRLLSMLLLALAVVGACTLGSQIIDAGKPCQKNEDCNSPDLECVRADSASANRVCMPIADGE